MKMAKQYAFFAFLFVSTLALAQKQEITGKVIDSKGNPIAGATIKIKATGAGTSTDQEGNFTLHAAMNTVLEINSVGFKIRYVTVKSTSINISLESTVTELQEVIMVGSRKGGRVKTESPVPVDVININQVGTASAKADLTSALNYAAPSFNYNKQSGADGADHVDIGTLRGLGPDQTLVLINGKRRHSTALVGLFGTRGKGGSGVDLNAFPEAAVDRIEILRDGASAQYGSDAIAGVMNIVLKKDVNHWTVNTGWSGYYDHKYNALNSYDPSQYYTGSQVDGQEFSLSVNNGWKIGKRGGFINVSADFLNQGKTFRQVPDTNVMTNSNALPTNTLRRAFGDGSIASGGTMYNMEIPLGVLGKTTFYSFGGYNYKASDAYAYSRSDKDLNLDRFPVDKNGNPIYDYSIMKKSSDGVTYYNPHIQTHITDFSFAAGVKGDAGNDWQWDLSNTLGKNSFHYYGDKTYNVSDIGNIAKTHFDDGGFSFLQNTTNLDFSKSFKSIAEGLNIGLGTEFRYENYKIFAGEEASWQNYAPTTTQGHGAQGFLGFRPDDVLNASRTNLGVYADAELNITKKWLLDGAVRFENYSDFGFVSTYKLATRYKVSNNFNLRGSVSTGYRAPSLQQINFNGTLTNYVGTQLVDERITNNNSAITKAAGIPNLKQETSVNASIGFSYKPLHELTLTVDAYWVQMKNRVVLSGLFSANDASLPPAFTNAIKSYGDSLAQFFDNAVNTTNTGIDVVLEYNKKWGKNGFHALLAGNFQNVNIDAINVPSALNDTYYHRELFYSDREQSILKASAPKAKLSLGLDYTINKLTLGTHITYFGDVQLLGFGWTGLASAAGTNGPGDPSISGRALGIDPYVDIDGYNDQVHVAKEVLDYKPKITTDIYASYKLCKSATLFLGADNLFNVHPNLGAVPHAHYEAYDNESGGPWDSVQMGFNGLRLFSKIVLNF